jgi:hypothetical protein
MAHLFLSALRDPPLFFSLHFTGHGVFALPWQR